MLRAAEASGLGLAEAFVRRGRSRRFRCGQGMAEVHTSVEEGWAVRVGDGRRAAFHSGSGAPRLDTALRDLRPGVLELPEPAPVLDYEYPESTGHPLLAEAEGLARLAEAGRTLAHDIAGGRFLDAWIEDGASESVVVSTTGVDAEVRHRSALLRLHAVAAAPGLETAVVSVAAASARDLDLAPHLRRLIDILRIRCEGAPALATRGPILLGPEVAARLVATLAPAFRRAPEAAARWLGAEGDRVATGSVDLYDDGRLPGGVLSAPVDGEGVVTGRRELVVEGRVVGALRPWQEDPSGPGCRRRASWRDLPAVGPSQMYLAPGSASPLELLAELGRGHYLIGCEEGLDVHGAGAALRVFGFAVEAGRAVAPVVGKLIVDPHRLLSAIDAVGRDLRFIPMGSLFGSPSLVVSGVDLVPDP
ncbi:MAG: metallopeptidase TldD-related protein [Thermoanaerobaculia bacterium]|nr:metallopeptidase TldD-related protein [Thermoanaerobaculia bacterium]